MASLLRPCIRGSNPDGALVPAELSQALGDEGEAGTCGVPPGSVYLASLAPGSQRTRATALRIMAQLIAPDADELTFLWHRLTFAHTTAIRAALAQKYAPATANRMLAA